METPFKRGSIPKKLVLATRNPKKIREIRAILKDLDLEFLTLESIPGFSLKIVEDGTTFEENAVKKAGAVARHTGFYALADDSGIVVEILKGRPGIFSSRYAGEGSTDKENNQKLLRELEGVPLGERAARYVCVIALVGPDGSKKTFKGECRGVIAEAPKGEGGFGYDPIFFIPEKGKTMAELSLEEKNLISHRAIALKQFKEWLGRALKRH